MKIHHEDTKATKPLVILSEAKDLASTRDASAVEARSFASLRMTVNHVGLGLHIVKPRSPTPRLLFNSCMRATG